MTTLLPFAAAFSPISRGTRGVRGEAAVVDDGLDSPSLVSALAVPFVEMSRGGSNAVVCCDEDEASELIISDEANYWWVLEFNSLGGRG